MRVPARRPSILQWMVKCNAGIGFGLKGELVAHDGLEVVGHQLPGQLDRVDEDAPDTRGRVEKSRARSLYSDRDATARNSASRASATAGSSAQGWPTARFPDGAAVAHLRMSDRTDCAGNGSRAAISGDRLTAR